MRENIGMGWNGGLVTSIISGLSTWPATGIFEFTATTFDKFKF